jgi:hypothetical protein
MQFLKNDVVCIFILESIKFMNINLSNRYKDQDFDICSVKLNLTNMNIVIISIYRFPSGNLNYFFKKIDSTLNLLHNNRTEVII